MVFSELLSSEDAYAEFLLIGVMKSFYEPMCEAPDAISKFTREPTAKVILVELADGQDRIS